MESGPVDQWLAISLAVGAEEDGGSEDSLETLNHSGVIPAVRGKVEEAEHVDGICEVDRTGLLLHRQCGNPDRNQPVLAEWQAVIRMSNDVEKEFAIAPAMDELGGWGAAEGKSAENEGPHIEGKLLPAGRSLLPDQADRFDLLQSAPRYSEACRTIADCG